MLIQVTAPHFCAGIVINRHKIISQAAPILAWAVTRDYEWFWKYCVNKGWKCIVVSE